MPVRQSHSDRREATMNGPVPVFRAWEEAPGGPSSASRVYEPESVVAERVESNERGWFGYQEASE